MSTGTKTPDTDEYTYLQVRIPVGLLHRFNVRCTQEQTTMTSVVIDAVEQYLAPPRKRR